MYINHLNKASPHLFNRKRSVFIFDNIGNHIRMSKFPHILDGFACFELSKDFSQCDLCVHLRMSRIKQQNNRLYILI